MGRGFREAHRRRRPAARRGTPTPGQASATDRVALPTTPGTHRRQGQVQHARGCAARGRSATSSCRPRPSRPLPSRGHMRRSAPPGAHHANRGRGRPACSVFPVSNATNRSLTGRIVASWARGAFAALRCPRHGSRRGIPLEGGTPSIPERVEDRRAVERELLTKRLTVSGENPPIVGRPVDEEDHHAARGSWRRCFRAIRRLRSCMSPRPGLALDRRDALTVRCPTVPRSEIALEGDWDLAPESKRRHEDLLETLRRASFPRCAPDPVG